MKGKEIENIMSCSNMFMTREKNRARERERVGYCHSNILLPYNFLILRILNLFNKFIYRKKRRNIKKIKGCANNFYSKKEKKKTVVLEKL